MARATHRADAAGFDLVGITLAAILTATLMARVWAQTGPLPLVAPLTIVALLVCDIVSRHTHDRSG